MEMIPLHVCVQERLADVQVLLLVGVPLLFERLPLQDGLQPPQQVGADQRVGAASCLDATMTKGAALF